jgi:hypothetical protein
VSTEYEPGKVYMHREQYNKLCSLMVTHTATGRKPITLWNGVHVVLDNTLPEGGWYIVPGVPQ